jgi:hypothetical protein
VRLLAAFATARPGGWLRSRLRLMMARVRMLRIFVRRVSRFVVLTRLTGLALCGPQLAATLNCFELGVLGVGE